MSKKKFVGWEVEKLKGWALYWITVGLGVFILLFLITSTWIGVSVRGQCQIAKARYKQDCVESLMMVLDDETNTLRERNTAIWALGQFGDSRALKVIDKYYTGQIPDREPYDATLSQYEMKKAIKLINGGFNITAVLWRSDAAH